MALPIDLWLIHPDVAMCDAFRARFEGLPRVRVIQSRFEDLPPHDCFVTAANAFGIMNAGIDAAVIRFHGEDLMRRIQFRILDEYTEVARQMAAAYRHYLNPPHRMDWDMVANRQRTIHYDGNRQVSR
ncbi:MAG: hypothetical protein SFV81_17855 [Pirellulaceae bacterium]|nr:hypothetical protein [Pirellulaceae bacterium]